MVPREYAKLCQNDRLIDNSIYLQTIVCLTAVYHCCSAIPARNYRYLSTIPKCGFLNNTKCQHELLVITVKNKITEIQN